MQIQPYLYFAGECEEALHFYRSIFGGAISEIFRYAGTPLERDAPPGWSEKVMHATFRAGDVTIMAADTPLESGVANNVRTRLCIVAADHNEGLKFFEALAAGGMVTVPYAKQFWGASFGMLSDRFGIPWIINAG